MSLRKNFIFVLMITGLLCTAACNPNTANNSRDANASTNAVAGNDLSAVNASKPATNRAADNAELRAADMAWSEAASKRDVDAVVGFMTDNGSTLPPNQPVQKGKDAIRKGWTELLGLKDLDISWTPTVVHVAESGEVGYTSGTWRMTFTDSKKGTLMDEGHYLAVWKKVDGKWKCEFDAYSSEQAAPTQVK